MADSRFYTVGTRELLLGAWEEGVGASYAAILLTSLAPTFKCLLCPRRTDSTLLFPYLALPHQPRFMEVSTEGRKDWQVLRARVFSTCRCP